jgi:phosphoglycolate phosphatase
LRSLLFDLDGTLLDTSGDLIATCNAAAQEFGLEPMPPDKLKPQISGGAEAMLKQLAQHGANGVVDVDPNAVLNRMLDLYEKNIALHTRLFDGMAEVLALLQDSGLPWGIVTNKVERFTAPLMQSFDFAHRPGCVISGDTFSEKKPHPLPMLEASRILGCRPEQCAYIGDARRDIEAGQNAGMTTLAAAYGYVDESDPARNWGADVLIDHPRQLLEWLKDRTQQC